jgi:hypothetical protein
MRAPSSEMTSGIKRPSRELLSSPRVLLADVGFCIVAAKTRTSAMGHLQTSPVCNPIGAYNLA